jgi:O-antigen/teichoic acid export membrane protein
VLRPILWFGALVGVGTYLFSDGAIELIYGHRHFGPAGTILKVFGPGFFLLFIDTLFCNALTAMGRSTEFSIAKIASVVVSTALDLVLIPLFQRRTGNGGIGVVTAFLVSEFVVFGGSFFLMPKGSLGPAALADVARAIGAAAVTGLLFHIIPPLPLAVGLPVCVLVFLVCTLAFRLVRRADLETFKDLLRRQQRSPVPLASAPGVSGVGSAMGVTTLPPSVAK